MRPLALVIGLGLFAVCGRASADPGDGASQPDPTVYAESTIIWDIAALREGDWVETEMKGDGFSMKTKLACVAIRDGLVWIEQTSSQSSGWVTLLGVDKADRETKKAYRGKAGEEAKELQVEEMPTGGDVEIQKASGTVKISKETVQVAGRTFDCEKIESDVTTSGGGEAFNVKTAYWMCEKVPFPSWYDEKSPFHYKNHEGIKVEGEYTLKGATLVKMTSGKTHIEICGLGTDAKMTVKLERWKRGYLGAALSPSGTALKVDRVVAGSPAEKAGLRAGDLIERIQGVPVDTAAAFVKSTQALGAGTEVRLAVLRDGKALEIKVTLGRHPQDVLEDPDTTEGLCKVRRVFDLAYGADERHKLNLILPVTDKPFPTVMWIHAGAWSFGGRENETALGTRFAERGIGFAAISHRLTGGAWMDPKLPKDGVAHPAHIEDCALAFAWLHANIQTHGGDPALIFVSGHSSGGHLAALLATDPRYLKAHDLPITAIKGSIPIGGCYDVPKYHAHLVTGIGKDQADAHCNAVFGDPAAWPAASPATYAKEAKVPMLVITEDVPGFRLYRDDFNAVVPEGSPIAFWDAADRVHETITPMMARKEADAPRDRMIEFIREQVGGK